MSFRAEGMAIIVPPGQRFSVIEAVSSSVMLLALSSLLTVP